MRASIEMARAGQVPQVRGKYRTVRPGRPGGTIVNE